MQLEAGKMFKMRRVSTQKPGQLSGEITEISSLLFAVLATD